MPDSLWKYCLRGRLRFLFILHLAAAIGGAVDLSSIPKPTGYVSDLAHVLNASDEAELEVFCVKVQEQLGAQFAIVTLKTLDGEPIENFSVDLFRKWGVGPKARNEGLLILLVIQDRQERIEVGRGLEQYITDAIAGDARRAMISPLQHGDYGGALMQGVRALAAKIAEGKGVTFTEVAPLPQQSRPQADSGGGFPLPLIIFIVIFLLIFFLSRRGGGGRGSGTGFWTGMILGSMLNSGRGGGGGWGGGGGFGGGSGGGGGFGGFGGGDSGGGGSSGGW